MQYMLLLNEPESEFARRNDPQQAAGYWGGWNAFIGAMAQAGVIVKGDGLQGPNTAHAPCQSTRNASSARLEEPDRGRQSTYSQTIGDQQPAARSKMNS